MRTVEFEAELTNTGVLSIPPDVAASLDAPTRARVILILGEPEEDDEDWRKLSLQQFLRGYAEVDAIYDDYDKHRTG
jgi:hypothetical protein